MGTLTMNNNMSLIVVSVLKGIMDGGNDASADSGSLLVDSNDVDITKQNTEVAIDETVSVTMTSVSVITMSRFFIFILCSSKLCCFLIPFVNFYLLQINTKNYL
jgi:hypothetical protein